MSSLGKRLKETRLARGWTLRALGERAGISPSHLCGIERGAQRPSAEALQKLAEVYGTSVAELTDDAWRPHPRRRWRLRRRGTVLRRRFRYRRPTVPEGTLAVLCREAAFYRLGRALIERVRAQKRPAPFWTALKLLMHGQNGAEQVTSLHLLDRALDLEDIEPQHVRFHRPVVQEPGRRWIAIIIEHEGVTFLFYPQVTIRGITGQYPTLDFLVCMSDGQRTWSADLEIDGPGHDRTPFKDADRDVIANLPVLRVRLPELDRESFVDRLLERLMRLRP